MSQDRSQNAESVINELLDRWEECQERGEKISPEELCREQPELLNEVRSRIARLAEIDGWIGKGADLPDWVPGDLPMQTHIRQLQFLQRGGLGTVYVGEDSNNQRKVAVKFLHRHLAADAFCHKRFLLEAEVTARLEHPGVIPLYGVGQTLDGYAFYAMRFIDGHSMEELIQHLHQDFSESSTDSLESDRRYRQLLNHFVSVCKTIAYAHNRGIVHRDIKPANVMLGRYGETIVVDWGLAVPVVRDEPFRQSGEKTLMPARSGDSRSDQGGGTPAYMSPEQASKSPPTPASDVYSLGATLFKILTGQPPVEGDSIATIKENVIAGRVRPAPQLRPSVPLPLAAIASKAMSLLPTDRYTTALELAEDVEAYLADEPVMAHREPPLARLARLSRRHRSATQVAIIALAVGSVLATFSFLTLGAYATRERFARKNAQTAQRSADQARQHAERLRRESLAHSARFLANSLANEIDLRWRILQAEAASPTLRQTLIELNRLTVNAAPDANRDDGGLNLAELEPQRTVLQNWLWARFNEHRQAVKTESWFVVGSDGTQLARVRPGTSIGLNFRHRDYFHGRGSDLDPQNMVDEPQPLPDRVVHISEVFESTNTHTLMVVFSVPIFDESTDQVNHPRIGVMGMSVELGHFAMNENTWLIDMRPGQFSQQRGLLLQHPKLNKLGKNDQLPRLSDGWVQDALKLRRTRLAQTDVTASPDPDQTVMRLNDPFDQTETIVAIEPVIIRGRPAEIADTGWIVAVSEAE